MKNVQSTAVLVRSRIARSLGILLIALPASILLSTQAMAGSIINTGGSGYCIAGPGTGIPWNWEIVDALNVVHYSGSVTGVTGTAEDVRDAFTASINAATSGDVDANDLSYPPCTGGWSFEIDPNITFSDPPVRLTVNGTLITDALFGFNPNISRIVPEPSVVLGLAMGSIALGRVSRRRRSA